MSFEGFEEFLCAKGHYSIRNVYSNKARGVCPICRSLMVLEHLIDETNSNADVSYGEIISLNAIDGLINVWRPYAPRDY